MSFQANKMPRKIATRGVTRQRGYANHNNKPLLVDDIVGNISLRTQSVAKQYSVIPRLRRNDQTTCTMLIYNIQPKIYVLHSLEEQRFCLYIWDINVKIARQFESNSRQSIKRCCLQLFFLRVIWAIGYRYNDAHSYPHPWIPEWNNIQLHSLLTDF